jgi:hypothetical protein
VRYARGRSEMLSISGASVFAIHLVHEVEFSVHDTHL